MCSDPFMGMKTQPYFQGPLSSCLKKVPWLLVMCLSEFRRGSCGKSFVTTNWMDQANMCKYFLVQSTSVIMHSVTLLSGFDERRFFDYGCYFLSSIFRAHFMFLSTFAVSCFSILFVTFPHLSHHWFVIYFGFN